MHERGFYKVTRIPETAEKKNLCSPSSASHLLTDVQLSSLTEGPHQRPGPGSDDHQASPFTFSSNDLPSTFLLASAFIHIWGSQWSSFNNSTRTEASCDEDWGPNKPNRQTHGYETRMLGEDANSDFSYFWHWYKFKHTGWLLPPQSSVGLVYENMSALFSISTTVVCADYFWCFDVILGSLKCNFL